MIFILETEVDGEVWINSNQICALRPTWPTTEIRTSDGRTYSTKTSVVDIGRHLSFDSVNFIMVDLK